MFKLQLTNFTKKLNSTKVPNLLDLSLWGTVYGEMIENTSFLSPEIRLLKQGDYASNLDYPYKYNYCYIQFFSENDANFFGKFFFITDWRWELGTWVITLQIDVLGTFKNTIGASDQYILRSAAEYDGAVEDALYPVKADFETATYYTYDISHEGAQVPVWCDVDDLGQWYIVGVIANTGTLENLWDWVNPDLLANNNGSVIYLVLDQNQMFALIQMLLKDVSVYDISSQEVSINLQKQLINPMQYIESIKLVPFKPNVVQDNGADKLLSKVPIGLNELTIPLSVEIKGTTVSIPGFRVLQRTSSYADLRPQQVFSNTGWISYHECRTKCYLHPQYDDRGKWVLGQPYSKYIIEVDPWGLIEVPGQSVLEAYKRIDLQGNPFFNIIYETWFDASTGACKLQISTEMESGASIPFYIDTAKISIDVPCHQSIQDVVGFKKTLYELAGAKVNYQSSVASAIGQVATFGLGSNAAATAGAKVGATTGIIGGLTKAASAATDWAVQEPIGIQALQALNYPTISGSGSSGDTYMVQARDFASPRVHAYWTILVDDNKKDHGRPLCKIRRVSSIPGYMICENAHFEAIHKTKTVTGAVVSFSDAPPNLPLVDLTAQIVATQSGYTGVNVKRAGKNLAVLAESSKNDSQYCTYDFTNNGINITATNRYARASFVFPVKSGQTYTLSFYGYGTANLRTVWLNDSVSWDSGYGRIGLSGTRTKYTKTITATSETLFIGFYATNTGTDGTMIIEDFMLETGSTATTYEPYNGNTYSVTWPEAGAITNGEIDITNGKVTDFDSGISYDVASVNIPTLQGVNNIFADTGDVSVTYYTNSYAEFMSAPEQQLVLEFMNGGFYYE